MRNRSKIVVCAALALPLLLAMVGRADAQPQVLENAVVHFGQPQPQTPAPAPVGNAVTHFLFPDDVTVQKGGKVTFVVNGGGHGIAIHRVSEDTTRADIAEDLCGGNTNEADRATRAASTCNATLGTANLNYDITDGDGDLVIRTGTNVQSPRVDDTEHSARILATSGRGTACAPGSTDNVPKCDPTVPGANPAGAFLAGSTGPVVTPPAQPNTPGNRIEVTFLKAGRYLVICMNRNHSLNDHMFGLVSVVDGENDDEDDDQDEDEDAEDEDDN